MIEYIFFDDTVGRQLRWPRVTYAYDFRTIAPEGFPITKYIMIYLVVIVISTVFYCNLYNQSTGTFIGKITVVYTIIVSM